MPLPVSEPRHKVCCPPLPGFCPGGWSNAACIHFKQAALLWRNIKEQRHTSPPYIPGIVETSSSQAPTAMETINRDQFKSDLRQLVARYITTSSTFDDHILAAEELGEAMDRLGLEVGKIFGR